MRAGHVFAVVALVVGFIACGQNLASDGGLDGEVDVAASFADTGPCTSLNAACTNGTSCWGCYRYYSCGHVAGYGFGPGGYPVAYTCVNAAWTGGNCDCFGVGPFTDPACTIARDAGEDGCSDGKAD
jgi:hypothetical protein